jgi:hypothetical protein
LTANGTGAGLYHTFALLGLSPLPLTLYLWRNTGSGFVHVPIPELGQIQYGRIAWADYDNDGRADFLVTGEFGSVDPKELWRNTGTGFTDVPLPGLPGFSDGDLAWGDYNNDGKPDFAVTGRTLAQEAEATDCQLWENTGSGFIQWELLGLPVSLGNGLYRFTDALAPGHSQRFYLLRAQQAVEGAAGGCSSGLHH